MEKKNSIKDAEVIIQKLPSDMGIHRNPRKGTLNGPEKILEDLEIGAKVLVDEVFPDEFNLEETHERMKSNTSDLVTKNHPLISIGGDHSISYPVIKAVKERNPELKLVWLDAHLDLKKKVDGHISHDVVIRELVEDGVFEPEEIFFVGVARTDHDEEKMLEEHDFNVYTPEELPKFLDEYDSTNLCYLSIDIDVLSKDEAPGTGYPDGQLSIEDVEKVINNTCPRYADLVEVAPSLDKDNTTLQNAKTIVRKLARINT